MSSLTGGVVVIKKKPDMGEKVSRCRARTGFHPHEFLFLFSDGTSQ